MHLLPVLDLRNGQVVHALGGRRQDYQPLMSCWTAEAHDPKRLAQALHSQLGCKSFYVADLDALERRSDNRNIIHSLIESGYQLWLDAGVQSAEDAQFWIGSGVERLFIASETLPSVDCLTEIICSRDYHRLVFSLDFFQGKLRVPFATNEHELVDLVLSLGITQFMVLDTAHVGLDQGTLGLQRCFDLRQRYSGMSIITGGGIRSGADLDTLDRAGVNIALVATALHAGRFNPKDWQKHPFV